MILVQTIKVKFENYFHDLSNKTITTCNKFLAGSPVVYSGNNEYKNIIEYFLPESLCSL